MIITAIALSFAALGGNEGTLRAKIMHDMLHDAAHLAGDKNPKKWVELTQGAQYDGEYSPPSGRQAEPEPSATVPVRYVPPYMREIPVIVKPAPRYVDADTVEQENKQRQANAQQANQQQVAGQQFGGQAGGYGSGGTGLTSSPVLSSVPGPLPSSGSATGSTAIATYGALPNATAVPSEGGQDD